MEVDIVCCVIMLDGDCSSAVMQCWVVEGGSALYVQLVQSLLNSRSSDSSTSCRIFLCTV